MTQTASTRIQSLRFSNFLRLRCSTIYECQPNNNKSQNLIRCNVKFYACQKYIAICASAPMTERRERKEETFSLDRQCLMILFYFAYIQLFSHFLEIVRRNESFCCISSSSKVNNDNKVAKTFLRQNSIAFA